MVGRDAPGAVRGASRAAASRIAKSSGGSRSWVSLGAGWKLIGLPGWVWLVPAVPEALLLLALAWSLPRHRLEQMGYRRTVALALVGVITAANVLALAALIASLLSAGERSGGELLLKGATICWTAHDCWVGREQQRGAGQQRSDDSSAPGVPQPSQLARADRIAPGT